MSLHVDTYYKCSAQFDNCNMHFVYYCLSPLCIVLHAHVCTQGNKLSDGVLTIGIFIITVPGLIVLIVWSALGIHFDGVMLQNEVSTLYTY